MNGSSDLSSAPVAANPAQLTPADLATVVADYKKKSKKFDSLTRLGLWGGLPMGLLLVLLRPAFGLIDDYNPIFFLGSVAAGLATAGAASFYRRRSLAELHLRCAYCDIPFLGPGEWQDVAWRAEHVVATGVCLTCGNKFFGKEAHQADE